MEKIEKTLFYFGMKENTICGRKTLIAAYRQGCPVYKLKNKLIFSGGSLWVYYALLPEYAGKRFFGGKGKAWKQKCLEEVVQKTIRRAEDDLECREIVITPELTGDGGEMPIELWAACLHRYAPFEKVCVSFSEEGGTFEARQAILLLSPYLRRMRRVVILGEECPASELFSDYLYYEYGLMLERQKKVPEKTIWLDLGREKENKTCFEGQSVDIIRINNVETLKFLDTAVKNGYNTES